MIERIPYLGIFSLPPGMTWLELVCVLCLSVVLTVKLVCWFPKE